ncbi:hypothetical protein QQ045_010539 [Rhodiola kirilowii]
MASVSKTLQCWNKYSFGKVNKRLQDKKRELQHIRNLPRTPAMIPKEKQLMQDIEDRLHREEVMWAQRSRLTLLAEGDNTRYFHARASSRHKTNWILKIKCNNGTITSVQEDIVQEGLQYFQQLFMSQCNMSHPEVAAAIHTLPVKISNSHNSQLTAPYTTDDITAALFQLHPYKEPGIDGYLPLFYQKYWQLLKDHFTHCCLQFLNHGQLESSINDTIITLIPKQENAQTMDMFRPISLSTVMAKTISKAITNRLQLIVTEVITPEQTTFLHNRSITDNFLIAHEKSHYIKNVGQRKKNLGFIKT